MKIQNYKHLRQPLTPEQQDQKLQHVSKLYEKQFLREMMKAMRGTVSEGGFMPANHAEKIFRGQLDEEYVEKWGDNGGIGLSKMIHEQLLEKLGPALGIRPAPQRPIGPIRVDARSMEHNPLKVRTADSGSVKPSRVMVEYDLQKSALEDRSISAPWAGTILGVKKLNDDENLIEMSHVNGLKSQMVFRGLMEKELQSPQLMSGTAIEAGQRLGLLSPEAKSFFWNVDVTDSL